MDRSVEIMTLVASEPLPGHAGVTIRNCDGVAVYSATTRRGIYIESLSRRAIETVLEVQ
jgi:hypothetical protein